MVLRVLSILAAAVLFGTTGTAQALGPDDTTPLSVGMARLLVGGAGLAVVAALAAWRRRRVETDAAPRRPRTRVRGGVVAVVMAAAFVAYQPLFFLGTARNGVAVGTVVALGSAPVLAGLLEWAARRRRPRGVWIAATVLATVGVGLLGFGGGSADAAADPVGFLGSLGAGASFAVFAVAQRHLLDAGWHPMTVAGVMGGGAALMSIPVLVTTDTAWLASASGLGLALWLGLATTTLAYSLFTWGLEGLTAATAATLSLAEPLTATIFGVALLGEQIGLAAIAGLVVLGAGLVVLAVGSRPPRDPEPFPIEA